jgi:hypothetical protein
LKYLEYNTHPLALKSFQKKRSPQKARGSISHERNQAPKRLWAPNLAEAKIKLFRRKRSLQKARGTISHRSKNQIISEELKRSNG